MVEHCPAPLYAPEEDEDNLIMFLGDDWRGIPLEVGAVERDDGDFLVIHAMRMRDQFAAAYEEANGRPAT